MFVTAKSQLPIKFFRPFSILNNNWLDRVKLTDPEVVAARWTGSPEVGDGSSSMRVDTDQTRLVLNVNPLNLYPVTPLGFQPVLELVRQIGIGKHSTVYEALLEGVKVATKIIILPMQPALDPNNWKEPVNDFVMNTSYIAWRELEVLMYVKSAIIPVEMRNYFSLLLFYDVQYQLGQPVLRFSLDLKTELAVARLSKIPAGKYRRRAAAKLVVHVTRAVILLNEGGYVHADIHPGNIMYSDNIDTYSLIDYGMVRHIDHFPGPALDELDTSTTNVIVALQMHHDLLMLNFVLQNRQGRIWDVDGHSEYDSGRFFVYLCQIVVGFPLVWATISSIMSNIFPPGDHFYERWQSFYYRVEQANKPWNGEHTEGDVEENILLRCESALFLVKPTLLLRFYSLETNTTALQATNFLDNEDLTVLLKFHCRPQYILSHFIAIADEVD